MTGVELIAQERQKQIEEGIEPRKVVVGKHSFIQRLFNPKEYKEKRLQTLIEAGATIAAEIDRLQAIEGKENDR